MRVRPLPSLATFVHFSGDLSFFFCLFSFLIVMCYLFSLILSSHHTSLYTAQQRHWSMFLTWFQWRSWQKVQFCTICASVSTRTSFTRTSRRF
jgi:hypothetical protein